VLRKPSDIHPHKKLKNALGGGWQCTGGAEHFCRAGI